MIGKAILRFAIARRRRLGSKNQMRSPMAQPSHVAGRLGIRPTAVAKTEKIRLNAADAP